MQVIVHGGAGSPADEPADRQAVLDEAAARGSDAETPLAAVCAAVRVLEADPRFNAGVGGAVQSDGRVRTDAGVMCDDGTTGAAASMADVCHAVDVARAVATETPHVLLAGERAVEFAAATGVETGVDLLTDRTRERWREADPPGEGVDEQLPWVRERFGRDDDGDGETGRPPGSGGGSADDRDQDGNTDGDHDTVGAVASDGETVAAATSTAGRQFALAGRVGDVPQVGAGFYAAPAGGASATGAGEDIARLALARRAVRFLADGADAASAAELAIGEFDDRADGDAGVIVLGADGTAGEAHSSPAMQTALEQ